jgi:hypothetical protein
MATTSQRHADASLLSLLADLQDVNKAHAENRLARIDVEAQYAEEQVKRENSAGTWYDGTQEMLDDSSAEFKIAFGENPTTVAEGKSILESLVHSLYDPESVLSATREAGDVFSLDRLAGAPLFPSGVSEKLPDTWLKKTPYGATSCQTSLIAATVATAAEVAAGAVSNGARALRAVQTSLVAAMSSTDGVGAALAAVAVRKLLGALGSQDALIAELRSVAEQIATLVDSMTDADYLFNHALFVRQQQLKLSRAESILASVEGDLLASGVFDAVGWEAARVIIKEVSETLRKLGLSDILSGFTSKAIKLLLLATYAELILLGLRRLRAIQDVLTASLSSFQSKLAVVKFDNLFAPVVRLVRCRLRKVIEDMDAVILRNRLLLYLIKEKQWSVETAAIAAFMQMTKRIRLPDKLGLFSGVLDLQAGFASLVNHLAPAPKDLSYLIEVGDLMVGLAKQKSAVNTPADAVVSAARSVVAACDSYIGVVSRRKSSSAAYLGLVVTLAPTAVSLVRRILDFARDRQCTSFTTAIESGIIDEAFEADSLTTSVEGKASSLIAHSVALFESGGGNRTAEADLLIVNRTFQNDARSLGLLDQLKNGYSSRHIEDRVISEGTTLRQNDARIRRASSEAGQTLGPKEPQFIPVRKARENYLAQGG